MAMIVSYPKIVAFDRLSRSNSSGSEPRSRSATPDSLDSLPSGGSGSPPTEWADPPPNLMISDGYPISKQSLYRTPSAPPTTFTHLPPNLHHRDIDGRDGHSPPSHFTQVPVHELFKPSELHWADVASNTEGIELLGYQRFGTIQGPRLGRERLPTAILIPENEVSKRKQSHSSVTRAHSVASERLGDDKTNLSRALSHEVLSFEQKFKKDTDHFIIDEMWPEEGLATNIEDLSENHLKKLVPHLWLNLTTLYDRHNLPFQKRKPHKRKKKEENNVFGVCILTLIRKDHLVAGEAGSVIPKILRLLLEALSKKVHEEGILRITGNKHKIDSLCQEIERNFYAEPEIVESAIAAAGCHEITAALKKFLRELPQPILTTELVQLFYQTHDLDGPAQGRALNLLVLLMAFEHRATLLELLRLLNKISQFQASNKMSEHNVAMIIAPTLFPPSLVIRPADGLEAQVQMAANSCRVTEALMRYCDSLWLVPPSIASQLDRKPHLKKANGHALNS
ncbi:rho GTPase-activating protein conundrum-like isoform X2 [Arctopsyche grandis]|uniref:rho GTPase-activating protein conundrum-like isoform X2 n=1 Tax=Arctopsyche grandis TaxID=121162 RepID=UPI00406D6980